MKFISERALGELKNKGYCFNVGRPPGRFQKIIKGKRPVDNKAVHTPRLTFGYNTALFSGEFHG